MRLCAYKTVMVVAGGPGITSVSPFNRFSRFFQVPAPNTLTTLKFFLKVELIGNHFPKSGGIRSKPKEAPAESDPAPENAAGETVKPPPEIKIIKLDCECFAPLVDTVLIHYEITGDLDQAEAVYLRVTSQKKADLALLEKKLDGRPQSKGIFMWDGAITDPGYQGCINLAGSPYWLQLGLPGPGAARKFTNKAAIRVELLQTELTVGDTFGLGEDDGNSDALDKLREELKRTPGKGTIRMPGSFFKRTNGEMNTSASYSVYFEFLGRGVPMPLFVRLSLKGKDGGRKRSPQAVAGTRILWDAWPEDEAGLDKNLSGRGVHETAKKFIKKVSVYKKSETDPPGATCQWELGGIRADSRARKQGRKQFGPLLDDWKTAEPVKRGWAGLSICAKAGEAAADSGMLYFNGRIAGDRYQVTAYVDLDGSLDDKDPKLGDIVPAPRKSATLSLQNWRDVRLSKSYKIGAKTTALNFDEANQEFRKGALSILPKPGLTPEDIQERWKEEYRKVLAILSRSPIYKGDADEDRSPFYRDAAEKDPGPYPAAFISPEDYWAKTNPDTGFFGKVWHRIKDFFGAVDHAAYIAKCDHAAYNIYSEVAKAFPLGEDGLTVFKFENHGEHNRQSGTFTLGIAPAIPGYTSRTQSVLFVFSPGQAAETVMHEMGHNLFLPHAPGHWESGKNPDGFRPDMHDKDQICLMSYHREAKYFCALCQLRMGGWYHDSIKNDGTVIDRMKPL